MYSGLLKIHHNMKLLRKLIISSCHLNHDFEKSCEITNTTCVLDFISLVIN